MTCNLVFAWMQLSFCFLVCFLSQGLEALPPVREGPPPQLQASSEPYKEALGGRPHKPTQSNQVQPHPCLPAFNPSFRAYRFSTGALTGWWRMMSYDARGLMVQGFGDSCTPNLKP